MEGQERKTRQEKSIEMQSQIEKELRKAPTFQGLTISQLAKATGTPFPTMRLRLQTLEERGVVKHFDIGKAMVYALIKKKEGRTR